MQRLGSSSTKGPVFQKFMRHYLKPPSELISTINSPANLLETWLDSFFLNSLWQRSVGNIRLVCTGPCCQKIPLFGCCDNGGNPNSSNIWIWQQKCRPIRPGNILITCLNWADPILFAEIWIIIGLLLDICLFTGYMVSTLLSPLLEPVLNLEVF